MASLNDIDQHVENCSVCITHSSCSKLNQLMAEFVKRKHGDILAAAGEVKVRRFFHPENRSISMLEIEKRGQKQLYTQEEAHAIEWGIDKLFRDDDD